jgi:beta-fructofuranosidase
MKKFFYHPADGVAGDFIPFYEDGVYHLFYLKDYRDPQRYGEGTPWFHVSTEDFITFREHGEAIPRGTREEQDLWVFTGSVIKAQGKYHIFYTGNNGYFLGKGKPAQAVMHAVSDDLDHWDKLPEDTFYADSERYEKDDFRDPFVFYDPRTKHFSMLLVSRKKNCGMTAGFTALYTSEDLKNWKDEGDFWAPNLYHTHECPDLFYLNGWWYLIYSEYSDRNLTRYVMSRDLKGPWLLPDDDAFDGRAYYAAKTAGDENGRFLFGWVPTKTNEEDMGAWQWGGSLLTHQLMQRPDGTLGCMLPATIRESMICQTEVSETFSVCGAFGRADELLFPSDGPCLLELTLSFSAGTKSFGITLCQDFAVKNGYKYEFVPGENTLRFDAVSKQMNCQNLCRPLALIAEKEIRLSLLISEGIAVLYTDEGTALSSRMYEVSGGDLGIYAVGGTITVTRAVLSKPAFSIK